MVIDINIKQRLPLALLTGFACGFSFFFFGIYEIFVANKEEFGFLFSDFAIYMLLISAGIFLLISAVLTFTRGKVFSVFFGIFFWIAIMGYIQGNFLNFGMNSLSGDDVGRKISTLVIIIDTVIWVAAGFGCIFGALKMKKHEMIKTFSIIALVMIIGMQLAGCASSYIKDKNSETLPPKATETSQETDSQGASTSESNTDIDSPASTPDTPSDGTANDSTANTDAVTDPSDETSTGRQDMYLTTRGLYEISSGKNVIVFLLDRFDVSFYNDVLEGDAVFFDKLDGFTYYNDNISLYSRTYPAIASMISGIDTDFNCTADEYFTRAYSTSPFLHDLKKNDYKIKLYTSDYYSYRNADSLYGLVDNISTATDYEIANEGRLVRNMMALAAYKYAPTAVKSYIKVSSSSFDGIIKRCSPYPQYEMVDSNVYTGLKENGLTIDDSENSFIFIHLNGCHMPFQMDENGDFVEDGDPVSATRGCFRMIYNYINEMKRLGVYEDATIIITGDHPSPINDSKSPTEPRLTALFIKESGKVGTPLAYSDAQVSQDNFIASIVKSSGIKTENDYGRAYSEVPSGEDVVRRHKFQLSLGSDYIAEFRIVGNGNDFNNWTELPKVNIGYLYK